MTPWDKHSQTPAASKQYSGSNYGEKVYNAAFSDVNQAPVGGSGYGSKSSMNKTPLGNSSGGSKSSHANQILSNSLSYEKQSNYQTQIGNSSYGYQRHNEFKPSNSYQTQVSNSSYGNQGHQGTKLSSTNQTPLGGSYDKYKLGTSSNNGGTKSTFSSIFDINNKLSHDSNTTYKYQVPYGFESSRNPLLFLRPRRLNPSRFHGGSEDPKADNLPLPTCYLLQRSSAYDLFELPLSPDRNLSLPPPGISRNFTLVYGLNWPRAQYFGSWKYREAGEVQGMDGIRPPVYRTTHYWQRTTSNEDVDDFIVAMADRGMFSGKWPLRRGFPEVYTHLKRLYRLTDTQSGGWLEGLERRMPSTYSMGICNAYTGVCRSAKYRYLKEKCP